MELLVIGSPFVGKTHFLQSMCDSLKVHHNYHATIEEKIHRDLDLAGISSCIEIGGHLLFDTCDRPTRDAWNRHNSADNYAFSFYESVDDLLMVDEFHDQRIVVFMFNVDNKSSFSVIKALFERIDFSECASRIIVGNSVSGEADKCEVSNREAEIFAHSVNSKYMGMCVSAGQNVMALKQLIIDEASDPTCVATSVESVPSVQLPTSKTQEPPTDIQEIAPMDPLIFESKMSERKLYGGQDMFEHFKQAFTYAVMWIGVSEVGKSRAINHFVDGASIEIPSYVTSTIEFAVVNGVLHCEIGGMILADLMNNRDGDDLKQIKAYIQDTDAFVFMFNDIPSLRSCQNFQQEFDVPDTKALFVAQDYSSIENEKNVPGFINVCAAIGQRRNRDFERLSVALKTVCRLDRLPTVKAFSIPNVQSQQSDIPSEEPITLSKGPVTPTSNYQPKVIWFGSSKVGKSMLLKSLQDWPRCESQSARYLFTFRSECVFDGIHHTEFGGDFLLGYRDVSLPAELDRLKDVDIDLFILVCRLDLLGTLSSIQELYGKHLQISHPKTKVILVCTYDNPKEKETVSSEARAWAKANGCSYLVQSLAGDVSELRKRISLEVKAPTGSSEITTGSSEITTGSSEITTGSSEITVIKSCGEDLNEKINSLENIAPLTVVSSEITTASSGNTVIQTQSTISPKPVSLPRDCEDETPETRSSEITAEKCCVEKINSLEIIAPLTAVSSGSIAIQTQSTIIPKPVSFRKDSEDDIPEIGSSEITAEKCCVEKINSLEIIAPFTAVSPEITAVSSGSIAIQTQDSEDDIPEIGSSEITAEKCCVEMINSLEIIAPFTAVSPEITDVSSGSIAIQTQSTITTPKPVSFRKDCEDDIPEIKMVEILPSQGVGMDVKVLNEINGSCGETSSLNEALGTVLPVVEQI